MKKCKKCGECLSEENHYPGYNLCKKCHSEKSKKWALENKEEYKKYRAEWMKEWRKNNPIKNRLVDRKKELKRLGVSIDDFNKILQGQEGKCAICSLCFEKENKKPCIDHCHKTGKVRGILCRICNMQLGHIESQRVKNYKFFQEAIKYLQNKH